MGEVTGAGCRCYAARGSRLAFARLRQAVDARRHKSEARGLVHGARIQAERAGCAGPRCRSPAPRSDPARSRRISYRIKALDPDAMFDEQFDGQVRRLRAERDWLKALPAEPHRWEGQPTGTCTQTSTRPSRLRTRRVADLARVRGPRQVSVIWGDARGTARLG
jgi:hypothetical protein